MALGALLLALGSVACGGSRPPPGGEAPMRSVEDGNQATDTLTVQLAETLIAAGATNNAVPLLRDALGRDPNDARLHYLLGTVLRDRGVYSESERELVLALKLAERQKMDPAPIHSGLGILYDLQGRPIDAKAAHIKAVTLAPKVARFHNNLGFSRYLAGDHKGAVEAFEKALSFAPNATRVYVNLGFAHAALGQDDAAMRMFRQTLTQAEALNNLALAHELHTKPGAEEARRLYREALQSDPGLEAAIENMKALDSEKKEGT